MQPFPEVWLFFKVSLATVFFYLATLRPVASSQYDIRDEPE